MKLTKRLDGKKIRIKGRRGTSHSNVSLYGVYQHIEQSRQFRIFVHGAELLLEDRNDWEVIADGSQINAKKKM